MRKKYTSIFITFLLIFGFSAPSLAATEDYFAGGGSDDGLATEIEWDLIDDTDLNIDDAGFPNGRTGDAFDNFGYVWVRISGTWYQVDGGPGLPADENASTYEITITETISGVLVTAKLTISDNNATWTITTDSPVERILIYGDLGSDGDEYWYNPSTNVWWTNDSGVSSGTDPLLRFETTTGGTLRQNPTLSDTSSAENEFADSDELGSYGNTYEYVAAISKANSSEFQLSVCLFDYDYNDFLNNVNERNSYVDNLNVDNCKLSSTLSTVGFPWVGAQSISCPDANPWVEQELGFANKVTPLGMASTNLVGRNISESNLQNLFTDGVYFDTESRIVSTATEVLPIYGCNDKLLKAKIGKPIQFIVGGFTLQSEARGYIQGASNNWYDLSGVTLHPDTAAFMHSVKFTKPGRYIVVITEQPDTSRGLIPTYGVRSVRFVININ